MGPNSVGVFPPHLRSETDPVSETSCFIFSRIPDDGERESKNLVAVCYTPSSKPSRIYNVQMFTSELIGDREKSKEEWPFKTPLPKGRVTGRNYGSEAKTKPSYHIRNEQKMTKTKIK
jgi:hypothetical protein